MRAKLFYGLIVVLLIGGLAWNTTQSCDKEEEAVPPPPATEEPEEASTPAPAPNQPPIANAGDPQTTYDNASVILGGTGYDPDGGPVTFHWEVSGGMLYFGAGDGSDVAKPRFYPPQVVQETPITCKLTVTDSEGEETSSYTIVTVKPAPVPNQPPVANAGPDLPVYFNSDVTLKGSGYDPDRDAVTFHWTVTGGTLSDYNIAQPVFYPPPAYQNTSNQYTCTLIVTDSRGWESSDVMVVTVRNVYPPAYSGSEVASFLRSLPSQIRTSRPRVIDSLNVEFPGINAREYFSSPIYYILVTIGGLDYRIDGINLIRWW